MLIEPTDDEAQRQSLRDQASKHIATFIRSTASTPTGQEISEKDIKSHVAENKINGKNAWS